MSFIGRPLARFWRFCSLDLHTPGGEKRHARERLTADTYLGECIAVRPRPFEYKLYTEHLRWFHELTALEALEQA